MDFNSKIHSGILKIIQFGADASTRESSILQVGCWIPAFFFFKAYFYLFTFELLFAVFSLAFAENLKSKASSGLHYCDQCGTESGLHLC